MSNKDLDALERGILEFEKELEDDCNNEWLKRVVAGMKNCYHRLEAIDNSNPSEVLEDLGVLETYFYNKWKSNYFLEDKPKELNIINTIKQTLLKSQEMEEDIIHYKGTVDNLRRDNALLKDIKTEQEKALKIIFEKNADIWLLKSCLTVELYNFSITKIDNCNVFNLTKEEFDLLKGMLKKMNF